MTIDWQHRELMMGWARLAAQGNPDGALVVQRNREQFPAQGFAADVMQNKKLGGSIAPPAPKPPPTVLERVSALGPGMSALTGRLQKVGVGPVTPTLSGAYGVGPTRGSGDDSLV